MLQEAAPEEAPAAEDELELPVGAAAVPDTGRAATVPREDPDAERFVAAIKVAQSRLNVALANFPFRARGACQQRRRACHQRRRRRRRPSLLERWLLLHAAGPSCNNLVAILAAQNDVPFGHPYIFCKSELFLVET